MNLIRFITRQEKLELELFDKYFVKAQEFSEVVYLNAGMFEVFAWENKIIAAGA